MISDFFFNLKNKSETFLIKCTLSCWFISKLLAWKVFTSYRIFPIIPVFKFLNIQAASVHNILFIVSLLLMLFYVFFKQQKYILILILLLETCSCLLDINRLQPWEYLFSLIIFAFIVNKYHAFLTVFIAILSFTYLYSGFFKLNPLFLKNIWKFLILHNYLGLNQTLATNKWIYHSGYLFALLELLSGIGLLFIKTRKWSALILILMHIIVLIILGPIGLNFNYTIWPWNVIMIIFLFFLLQNQNFKIASLVLFSKWNKLIFFLVAILPFFNLFGFTDANLSFRMYTGNSKSCKIILKDTAKANMLKYYFKENNSNNKIQYYISIDGWAMQEMKVPVYSEKRVYDAIDEHLKTKIDSTAFDLYVY